MIIGLKGSAAAGKLLFTVSAAALVLGSTTALAADFTAGTDQQLRDAFAAAVASPDASSTITMTGNITLSAEISSGAKQITLVTQGFTLSGATNLAGVGGNVAIGPATASSGILTISGTLVGGSGTTTGGTGLWRNSLTASGTNTVINNGSITGGTGGTAGGIGAQLLNVEFLVNNGTVTGGSGPSGASGVQLSAGATLTNNGLVQGGDGPNAGGTGVIMGGSARGNTLVNAGTIRGGASLSGTGGSGVRLSPTAGNLLQAITNTGTIEGGAGALAIAATAITNLTLVNSGTIRAGAGQAVAIQFGIGATAVTTLELQPGSLIIGDVVAGATGTSDTLRLGGDSNWTLDGGIGSAGQYRNFDRLEKTGTSTWTVTGSGDFAGPTNVLAGRLLVNGSLAGSAVTVASGATLGGSGTVGATTIATGGTIAPGNSIGTLTINGAFVQDAGSTYRVEVDPGTVTSDRIAVNGTATLASGANLSVVNYSGVAYSPGQRYTILTSTGGLTGSYGFGEQVLTPFFSLRDSYDANNAYLTVVQTNVVGGIGTTPNEVEVGKSVDGLPTGDPVQSGVLNQASLDAARRALNQLSGEIHASARTALVDESWLLRAAVNDRLRAAFGGVGAPSMATMTYGYTADLFPTVNGPLPTPASNRFAIWGQGYGAWGRTGGDGNAASLSRSMGGFLLGADVAAFDTQRFGVLAGYSHTNFDVNARSSSGESDNYHLALYGGGQWGSLSLRTGAAYTWHDVETRRAVTAPFLVSHPRADYDAGTTQVFGEVGYRVDLGRAALEPFGSLAYVNLHTGRFAEQGATTALTAFGADTNLGYATLGLRASTSFDLRGMSLTVRGGLAWQHAFGDVDPSVTLAFAGSRAFTVTGLPIARDAAMVEAGLDVAAGRGATLGIAYTGQLAQDTQDHSFKGVLAVMF